MRKAATYFFLPAFFFLLWSASAGVSVDHSGYSSQQACFDCHAPVFPTHRLAIPGYMSENLPLESSGRMGCLTCHDCASGTCTLRTTQVSLCRVCHDCSRGMACFLNAAHMGDSPDIERFVRDCRACHDGVTGKFIEGPAGHKVDVLYHEGREFKVITSKRIILVNGKVTCISCHDPYGQEKGRLTVSNSGSALCLSCHLK